MPLTYAQARLGLTLQFVTRCGLVNQYWELVDDCSDKLACFFSWDKFNWHVDSACFVGGSHVEHAVGFTKFA